MKKINFLIIFFFTLLFATLSTSFRDNPDNPPNGYTGSGVSNCGSCHSGGSFGSSIIITGVPSIITPSTVYSISVTASKTSGLTRKTGFQMNVKNASNVVTGTLTSISTNVKVESGQYVEHSETSTAQNFSSNSGALSKTWTFNWTSPATTSNNTINFYVCSVIADDSGDTDGDEVVLNTATGTFGSAPAPLTVTQVTKTNVSCLGGSNGTATVNATGGSGCSYTYLWSNGQTGAIATGLAAGTYSVTATCGASTGSTSVSISQPSTALAATTTGSTLNCVGGTNGTASVSASGGGTTYAYLWSNNQTGTNLTNLSAGTYTVTITDNNTCTLVKTAVVNPPSNPVSATASSTAASCATAGTATATPANGTGPYTYIWSDGQTNSTATGLSPNSYTVTVTDVNGCKTTTSTTVSSNTTLPPATISGNSTLTCSQNSLNLSAPSGAYSYAWSSGENTPTINVTTAGAYTVTVTNPANGCTASGTKTIAEDKTTVPVAISGNTTLTCGQAVTTLSVGGNNSFQWSGPGILTSTTSASVNVNAAGNYSVTMTNLSNGCTSTSNTTVSTNFNAPTTPNINPSNPSLSCSNTFATLSSSASSSFSHQWKLNGSLVGSGTQYNATQAGAYTLIITDPSNGCTASANTTVTSTNVVLSVNATGGKITCANPTINLTANAVGAVSYNWVASGFNSAQQNPSTNISGTYTVIATDANGCTGSAQATVLNDTQKPNVTASATGTLSCANPTVTLNASSGTSGLSYAWVSNAGFNASGNPVTTQQAGIVTVTATNPTNGCTNTASVTVTASNDKPILATVGGVITCNDTIINVKVNVTGNTTGLTYKWSGPSSFTNTTASANVKKSGDYIVTVTAGNGCSSIATANVTADNQAITAQIETSKAFICSTDSISLTATSTSTIQSYIWSNTTTKNSTTATKSGVYQVTVTGSNGCKGSASVTVTDGASPIISLNADSLTCSISKLIIGATITWGTPVAPSWTGANNFTSSVLQPEVSAAGTYKLSINPADGCPASAEITIKENKTPPVVKISGEFINCEDSPVTLIATSTAASFLWSGFGVDANTSATVTATKSGKYSVTSTGSNGCVSQDSVEVKIFPAITSSADMTICSSGSSSLINLTVGGGKSPFVLTDSSGVVITSTMVKPKTGLLPITIVDANGCKSQISTIKATLGLLAIDKTTTIVKDATGTQFNGSITLTTTGITGTAKYAWSNGALTKDLLGLNSATYCVTVTDDLGCSITECFTVKSVISTEDNILAQAIRVFPNPTNEILYLETTESIDIQGITLLNDKGQALNHFDCLVPQINLSLLPQGIYFLKIESQNGEWAMKRVVKL